MRLGPLRFSAKSCGKAVCFSARQFSLPTLLLYAMRRKKATYSLKNALYPCNFAQ